MSELYKEQAEFVRDGFVDTYESIKTEMEKNFNDMDFENAVQREEVNVIITSMKGICDDYIDKLQKITFL